MTFPATRAIFTLLFAASTLSIPSRAQDKTPEKPTEEVAAPSARVNFRTYEEQLKTTDCKRMPTRIATMDCTNAHAETRTIYLANTTTPAEANEILIAVRNLFDPSIKVFLVSTQNAIVISTYPEELARIEALIRTLDRPHATYRLTYTVTESDSGKPVGVQHFSMALTAGQRSMLKQGSKVPFATGASKDGSGGEQFQYLDVGMNFDATLDQVGTALRLRTKVEQSSIAESKSGFGDRDPIIRQTVIEDISSLTPGKALNIGSIDVSGSTRHIDVSVEADLIP